jgi:hypothetical protein
VSEGGPGWHFHGDPLALEQHTDGWHLRVVQPYRARKLYRCPGCNQEIFPGTGHLVAWPDGAPEQRRHWHRPCWNRWFEAWWRDRAKRGRDG